MGIPMKAKRGFVYAGHNYRSGQDFEAHSENNARFLAQVGHAERVKAAPVAAPVQAPVYRTRALVAATPSTVAPRLEPTTEKVEAKLDTKAEAKPRPRTTKKADGK